MEHRTPRPNLTPDSLTLTRSIPRRGLTYSVTEVATNCGKCCRIRAPDNAE